MHSRYSGICYGMKLRRSAAAITEVYDRLFEAVGMSLSQYALLAGLYYLGQSGVKEWADEVGLERTTLIRSIRALSEKGWIEQAEGKGKQYRLSEKGRVLYREAYPLWKDAQRKIEDILGLVNCAAVADISDRLQEFAIEND